VNVAPFSEWRQVSCSRSLTLPVIHCRFAQPKSAIDDENRTYDMRNEVVMQGSSHGVRLRTLQCLLKSVRQPNYRYAPEGNFHLGLS
jgi:hypothetical protein